MAKGAVVVQSNKGWLQTDRLNNFLFLYIFGGLECFGHSFAYVSPIFFIFWEMSGFEPRELP